MRSATQLLLPLSYLDCRLIKSGNVSLDYTLSCHLKCLIPTCRKKYGGERHKSVRALNCLKICSCNFVHKMAAMNL